MLGFFPEPHPDELLYGLLSRYHTRGKFANREEVFRDIFGSARAAAVIDLPGRLRYLVKAMPPGNLVHAESLIEHHTLLPYYAWFLPPERLERIRQDMVSGSAQIVKLRLGLLPTGLSSPRFLRVCPECAREEVREFGHAYWHRLHQLHGVVVCPRHLTFLKETRVAAVSRRIPQALYLVPLEAAEWTNDRLNVQCGEHSRLLNLVLDSYWLLTHVAPRDQATPSFRERYLSALYEKGFASIRGRVSISELTSAFINFYGDEFLNRLGCGLNQASEHWLCRLLRSRERAYHPIRHLLFIRFLGFSAEGFFRWKVGQPFGVGPWPCLNPVSDHYQDEVIRECVVKRDKRTGKIRGTFVCPCGFVYTRWGPDSDEADRLKRTRVCSYGGLWEERLRDLHNSGASLKSMCRILHADARTIRRYINRSTDDLQARTVAVENRKIDYREKWLQMIDQVPGASRSILAIRLPAVARWLRANDKEWLEANSPKPLPAIPNQQRVNWEARDQVLSAGIIRVVQRIRLQHTPVRISTNFITSELGAKGMVENNVDRLPNTLSALKSTVGAH